MVWSTQDRPGGSDAVRVGRDAVKVKKIASHDILGKYTRAYSRVTHPTKKYTPRVLGS